MQELESLVLSTFLIYAGVMKPEYFSQLMECLEEAIKKYAADPRAPNFETEFFLSIYGGLGKLIKARMLLSISSLPILMIDPRTYGRKLIETLPESERLKIVKFKPTETEFSNLISDPTKNKKVYLTNMEFYDIEFSP
jgi:hypothetical protein